MEERVILHSDCNSFFASVEEAIRPELKNYPMAVCGSAENRHGIILAKNQLAKKYDIKTAETIVQARRKCPELVLVEPHYHKYSEYSAAVNQIYTEFTDLVEPFGIDESWLDVTGSYLMFGNGTEIAHRLRNCIRNNLGITVSVGVSFNKVFAKLGSDYKKPDAVTEITRGNYRELVHPLKVTELFMVGGNIADELRRMGIVTIGELAMTSKDFLIHKLGKHGATIHDYANGLDFSPVVSMYSAEKPKSVGNGMTFKRDLVDRRDICVGVAALSDIVSTRLRHYGLRCRTLQVSVKNSNFKTVSKQKMLSAALNSKKDIYDESMYVMDSLWKSDAPIRSITITCTHLLSFSCFGEQLDIFGTQNRTDAIRRHERVDAAVDEIRQKYGRSIISFASQIVNDIGV
ncbi:MAG: DNA polymerase IV [Ruminococcaceae bacterium]|nr:DNA polymerase IV [Oscillospiraceae bacterium]